MNREEATLIVQRTLSSELSIEPNEYDESTKLITMADSLEMALFASEIEDITNTEIEIENMSTFTVGQLISFVEQTSLKSSGNAGD